MNVEKNVTANSNRPLLFSDGSINQEIRNKIRDFENGDISALSRPDIIEVIAQHIYNLYSQGEMRYSLILLENLGEWSRNDRVEQRERSLMALSLITEKVLQENNEDFLEALSGLFIRWLKFETQYLTGFEHICLQLRKVVKKMLDLGMWYQSEDLIIILFKIKNGVIKKDKLLTQVIAQTHSSLAETECLRQLTDTYIDGTNDKRGVAGTLLVHFGKKAVYYLVYTLSNCPDREKRLHLIDLIPTAGASAIPALVSRLQKEPPWYVVRNIILILSRLGDPSLFSLVRPFMSHEDIRVQQEVISCIEKMNGNRMLARLLEALIVCNDTLKRQILRIIEPLKDKRIGETLTILLENIDTIDRRIRSQITNEVCAQLTEYPSAQTISALENILDGKTGSETLPQDILATVRNTLSFLRQKMEIDGRPERGAATKDVLGGKIIDAGKTQHIDPLTASPATDTGQVEKTFSLFDTAQWRVQSFAGDALPPHFNRHLALRKNLYSRFKSEEFSAFTSYLHFKNFRKGETLVAHGDIHSNLYFIDSGKVELLFPQGSDETSARPLQDGDIFGNDIFMSGSEWEVSLLAASDVEAYVFDQENLLKMRSCFPELALKFLEYCKEHDVILSLFRMLEQRITGGENPLPITFTGNGGEYITDVELVDFSTVGCCFSLHLPTGFSHSLFADKKLSFFFAREGNEHTALGGEVIGLKFLAEEKCLLYIFVKFNRQFQQPHFSCTRIGLH